MELDQEKLTRNESERSRELAQRIRRELGPCSVQVLGGVGALESALEATGAVQPAEGALPELLVVVDPEWVTLPQQLADQVLLVCSEETMLAACAKQLAQQGLYRDFSWQSRGRALQTALFCRTDAPDAAGQLAGYEEELDILRERMELAERTGEEQGRQLERLRLRSQQQHGGKAHGLRAVQAPALAAQEGHSPQARAQQQKQRAQRGDKRRAAPARQRAPDSCRKRRKEVGQRAMLRLHKAQQKGVPSQNPQMLSKTRKGGRGHAAIPLCKWNGCHFPATNSASASAISK